MRGLRVSRDVVKRVIFMAVILVSCVGCDQATKSIAKSIIPETESWSYLGDTVRLQVVYNRGAFLSVGSSLPEAWRFGLFSIGVRMLPLRLEPSFSSQPHCGANRPNSRAVIGRRRVA